MTVCLSLFTITFSSFLSVWEHGQRRFEDAGGGQEVSVWGAVSGLWGMDEYCCTVCSVRNVWSSTFLNSSSVIMRLPIPSSIAWSVTACLTQKRPCYLSPIHAFLSLSIQNRYNQAKLSIHDRGLKVAAVVESLEREMELLCLTGVEDQLQADVRPTLELLRNAGIKVSMEAKHIYTIKAAKENHTTFPLTYWSCFLLRSGCWRGTSLRRLRASPKAPIWSPEAKTSTSSDR